jgi:hypothetical protein
MFYTNGIRQLEESWPFNHERDKVAGAIHSRP